MRDILTTKARKDEANLHRDPISGTPGAHPLGTVAGGLIGKGAAESVNPTAEEAFWTKTYVEEPYYLQGKAYEYYAPAYRIGWEGHARFPGRKFDEVEAELRKDYERFISEGAPDWQIGRQAARSAWNRVDLTSTIPDIKLRPGS